jgi:hypothetical protein
MNLLDLLKIQQPELVGVFNDFVVENPLIGVVPTEIASSTKVQVLRNSRLNSDSSRLPGGTTTSSNYIHLEKDHVDMVIRYVSWLVDNYETVGQSAAGVQSIADAKGSAAVSALGTSLNSAIINGANSTTEIYGWDRYCLQNDFVSTHGTIVTSAALALTFMGYLQSALRETQMTATHIVTSTFGLGVIETAAYLLEQRLVMVDDPLGRAVPAITILGKTLPIVWAGYRSKTVETQDEVIKRYGSDPYYTDFYLADLTGNGIGMQLFNYSPDPVVSGANEVYTLEQYQAMLYKTTRSVWKFVQRIA